MALGVSPGGAAGEDRGAFGPARPRSAGEPPQSNTPGTPPPLEALCRSRSSGGSRPPVAFVATGSAMSQNLTPTLPVSRHDLRTPEAATAREARDAPAAARAAARAAAKSAARAARLARLAEPVRVANKHDALVRASHWAHVPLLLGLIAS